MRHTTSRARRQLVTAAAVVAAATTVLAGCGDSSAEDGADAAAGDAGATDAGATEDAGSDAGSDDTFTVGFATGGQPDAEWQQQQGVVAQALVEAKGWEYVELSNDMDEATATRNADVFIQQGVDAVVTFNGRPSVNPVIAAKYEAAGIPVITFDIAQEGWYFVGVDNLAAGTAGGEALGQIAEEQWDCEVDLVLSAEGSAAGVINEQRTGGGRDGIRSVCPDIPEENFVSFESDGQLSVGLPAARDALAANPDAERILVVGLNDAGVVSALEAATQLGRDQQILGWGQDGALIVGDNVDPNLAGSVLYFLEGYMVYAMPILESIANGDAPPMQDTGEDAAAYSEPCAVTAEQAQEIPDADERVQALIEAEEGTTLYDLYCPQG